MNKATHPQLGALELNCRRFAAMVGWYRDLLGAEIEYRDALHAWLRAPGGWHLALIAGGYEARPRECAGLNGPSFEYANLPALAATYRALRMRNVYPERAVKNGIVTSLVYRDPDGNPVSLRYLLPSAQWPAASINPLGDEFDPEPILGAAQGGGGDAP
jgi:catechol-2,3-dioxygenase